jgi:hypothetical protein
MDITLCTDKHCPSRGGCLRNAITYHEHYQASNYQSYADFNRGESDRCLDGFEPIPKAKPGVITPGPKAARH